MENDYHEHIVEVSSHIEVKLKIPKRLTAMALKGLMLQSSKLMNLSEITIGEDIPKRKYKLRQPKFENNVTNKQNSKKGAQSPFSKEMDEYVTSNNKKGFSCSVITKPFNEKFGTNFSRLKIQGRAGYLNMKKNKMSKSYKRRGARSIFTDEMNDYLIFNHKKRYSLVKLHEHFNKKFGTNFSKEKIRGRVKYLKATGKY